VTAAPTTTPDLEAKLDTLSEQVAFLTAEAMEQRQRREAWDELRADLVPIAAEVAENVSDELESLGDDVKPEDLLRLSKRLLRDTRQFEGLLDRLNSTLEFLDDAGTLGNEMMLKAVRTLEDLEDKGYFDLARAGAGVVDRVAQEFEPEDIEALGDNVATILHTVKEITQPEMLALLQRMIDALQHQQEVIEHEPADPPSVFALVKKMRDPDVRRGINRALDTLGSVSAETGPEAMKAIHDQTKKDQEKGAA
jgi:uncharacterized protein YjgD (DUF1641 family)